MGRRGPDSIDLACRAWAADVRKRRGLDPCDTAAEYLGATRCTLAQREDLHAGGRSVGRVEQRFPEVYTTPESLAVAKAYHSAREELRIVLELQYVERIPADERAARIAKSLPVFYQRLAAAKTWVESWLNR